MRQVFNKKMVLFFIVLLILVATLPLQVDTTIRYLAVERMFPFVIGLFTGPYGDLFLVAYALMVSAICTVGNEMITHKSRKR